MASAGRSCMNAAVLSRNNARSVTCADRMTALARSWSRVCLFANVPSYTSIMGITSPEWLPRCAAAARSGCWSDADEVEFVAFGVGEGDPACLAGDGVHDGGPEVGQSCGFAVDIGGDEVEVDAVLYGFAFGYLMERQARAGAH